MSNYYKQQENIFKRVDTLVEDELQKDSKEATCSKGCFYCCTFPIAVGVLELLYIVNKINKFSDEKKNIILKNIDTSYQYSYKNDKYIQQAYFNNTLHNFRTICPFLNNGSCMIYEFRPSNCRANFSSDIKLCQKGQMDMNFLKNTTIHTLANISSAPQKEDKPTKGFLHNAFIFDGVDICVDPIYIFEDTIKMDYSIKLSNLIMNR